MHEPDEFNDPHQRHKASQTNAFYDCIGLINVTNGNSLVTIGDGAFDWCTNLTGVYFQGNAPALVVLTCSFGDNRATIYYLLGTTGWVRHLAVARLHWRIRRFHLLTLLITARSPSLDTPVPPVQWPFPVPSMVHRLPPSERQPSHGTRALRASLSPAASRTSEVPSSGTVAASLASRSLVA